MNIEELQRDIDSIKHRRADMSLLELKFFIHLVWCRDEIEKLRANAMPGGHGCCDICDTGGCCKAESEEE